jgi:lipoprotein NlpI
MPAARLVVSCLAIALSSTAQDAAERPQMIFERAVSDFKSGRIAESVKGFDHVAALLPAQAPHLWQRGIALYYAGRYKDCRAQFESHRTVNPDDVENAAWHFLCVARAQSPDKAKAALLPVGPDSRVPMQEIYRMFRGELKPEAVLTAAGTRPESQFYAHLYVGLYAEALNNSSLALQHIRIAAEDRFKVGGYMHDVARVHLSRLTRASSSAPDSVVWTFDRLDRIGGYASTILGQPRLIDTTAGKAVEFDGVDDAIFLDIHPLAGAETFTWEVLFRPYRGGSPEQRFFHLQERDPQTGADTLSACCWRQESSATSGVSTVLRIHHTVRKR